MDGDARIAGYATAILEIARAEGDTDRIADELFRIAKAFDSSEPLRQAMTDSRIPVDRKHGIIDELLGSRASSTAVQLVNFIVGQGMARQLGAIADTVTKQAAAARRKTVAEIRSAAPLDDDTVARLAARLSEVTGKDIEPKVVVDPQLVGGIVAKVGDQIFDGSVKSRLEDLREAWG